MALVSNKVKVASEKPLNMGQRIAAVQSRSRGSWAVKKALAEAKAAEQRALEAAAEFEKIADKYAFVSGRPRVHLNSDGESDNSYDASDYEEDSDDSRPSVKRMHQQLSSPFEKEDLLPKYNKRQRSASVSPGAKSALKQIRAKIRKEDTSRSPSPPSPYNGIMQISLRINK
jgi:hypothetical protein